uniref:Uncharacterized protein n=1 Tax=Arundo donax TaxID=35708 RepID=A0A0A9DRE2_ARUDO
MVHLENVLFQISYRVSHRYKVLNLVSQVSEENYQNHCRIPFNCRHIHLICKQEPASRMEMFLWEEIIVFQPLYMPLRYCMS